MFDNDSGDVLGHLDCNGGPMRKIVMKPETIARRAIERAAARRSRREEMIKRVRALVERDGPDSIWPGMLAELEGSR